MQTAEIAEIHAAKSCMCAKNVKSYHLHVNTVQQLHGMGIAVCVDAVRLFFLNIWCILSIFFVKSKLFNRITVTVVP